MAGRYPFQLLTSGPDQIDKKIQKARSVPEVLNSHERAAEEYETSANLLLALNTAIALGAPLLIAGEPGTGKTQAAYWAARKLGVKELFRLNVNSETTFRDLLYRFDYVAHYQAAMNAKGDAPPKANFVLEGPLWRAFAAEEEPISVVLIDEIDKAPRDFPNDLLHVLDQHEFDVPELGTKEKRHWVRGRREHPPLVVITTNTEKELPAPFLRRCVFHHIAMTDELIATIVTKRLPAFAGLKEDFRNRALACFKAVKAAVPSNEPGPAELLAWLSVLAARKIKIDDLDPKKLAALPSLECLVKTREGLASVRGTDPSQ